MTSSNYFTGLRMMDVRIQIAQVGNGLDRVDKVNAGHYIISTQDGRSWHVIESAGLWRGEAPCTDGTCASCIAGQTYHH